MKHPPKATKMGSIVLLSAPRAPAPRHSTLWSPHSVCAGQGASYTYVPATLGLPRECVQRTTSFASRCDKTLFVISRPPSCARRPSTRVVRRGSVCARRDTRLILKFKRWFDPQVDARRVNDLFLSLALRCLNLREIEYPEVWDHATMFHDRAARDGCTLGVLTWYYHRLATHNTNNRAEPRTLHVWTTTSCRASQIKTTHGVVRSGAPHTDDAVWPRHTS